MKKTKIIATMWPAVESEEKIIQMYKNWINIIRFNFSHAEKENVKKIVAIIKKLNKAHITDKYVKGSTTITLAEVLNLNQLAAAASNNRYAC